MKYFYEKKSESKVYEIKEVKNLDEAKETAFSQMNVSDILCECRDDVDPREEDAAGYHINVEKCDRACTLEERLYFDENDTESGFFLGIPQTIIRNLTAKYTWAEYSRSGKRFYTKPRSGVWFDAEYNIIGAK